MSAILQILLIFIFFEAENLSADQDTVTAVSIYAAYETAGVQIQTKLNSRTIKAEMEYKAVEEDAPFRKGHPFVAYDANHLATSLFGLQPGKEYLVKITLRQEENQTVPAVLKRRFNTKSPFSIPRSPNRIVVNDAHALQEALKNLESGTELLIKPGIYSDRVILSDIQASKEQPLVLQAYNIQDKPHFLDGILINRSAHIILKGLEIELRKTKEHGGVRILGSNNITVTDCYIHDCGENYSANIIIAFSEQNVGMDKNGYHLIQNNILSDETPVPPGKEFTHKSFEGQTYYGIKLDDNPGGFNIIRNNVIYGVIDGIACGGDEKEEPVLDPQDKDVLKIWPHQNVDVYENIIFNVKDDGIETDGHMVNGRIFRNRIGKCQNAISTAAVYPGPLFILRNYMYGFRENAAKMNTRGNEVTRNVFWYHNTIKQIKSAKHCILRGNPGLTENIVFRNNIIDAVGSVIETYVFEKNTRHLNHSFDYDLLYSLGKAPLFVWGDIPGSRTFYNTLEDFQNGTEKDFGRRQETHALFAEPLLNMTTIPGYNEETALLTLSLLPGSPGIDTAVIIPGINNDFFGTAPDMGAYEVKTR